MAPISYYTDTSKLNRPYMMKRPQEYYNNIPRLAKQYGPNQQLEEEDDNDPVRRMLREDGDNTLSSTPQNTYGSEIANRLGNLGGNTSREIQSRIPSQASTAQTPTKGFASPYMQQLSKIGQLGKQATSRVEAINAFKSRQSGGGGGFGSLDLSGVKGARAKLIAAAKSQLGVPYVWGGEQKGRGFDCSGLVQWAYGRAGIRMPRVSQDQMRRGKIASIASLKPGDLVGWGHPAHHIAIYLGGGKIIEAPRTGLNVRITSLSKKSRGAWGIHLNI